MVDIDYIPDKGHIIWITCNPQAGHEQMGRRPALVLSPSAYNERTNLAIMCPVTSSIKGYPFEVVIPDNLPIAGVILADQVKSLDWKIRKAEYCCDVKSDIMKEVLSKLQALLFD